MSLEIGRLLTAMITPFKSDGSVDYAATEKLAAMLVADGSDGVVVSGTTGESPTLSDDEKIELIKVIKKAIPRHSVVAGTGSSDTHHSVELSERAMKAGADALLAAVPYYSKPPQFKVWSGDDSWTLPVLAVGGHGVICVVSHIAGRSMKKLIEAYARADTQTAREIHHGLLPVIKALMTTAANPVPVKSALNAMGFAAGPFRLPLVPLTDDQLKSVMQTIGDAGDLITYNTGVKVA